MGRQCSVTNCSSKQTGPQKVSFFKGPKTFEQLEEWSKLLGCRITDKSFICEKHFDQQYIKTSDTVKDAAGNILYNYQFKTKKLVRESVPFCHNPLAMNVYEPARKVMKLHSSVENTIKNEELYATEEESIQIMHTEEVGNKSNLLQLNNIKFEGVMGVRSIANNLYHKIATKEATIKLPRCEWGLHSSSSKELFIFSQIELADPVENENILPIYTKQVIFNSHLEIQFCFLGKYIQIENVRKNVECIEELENLLTEIDKIQVCEGGPSIKYFKNSRPECAAKGQTRWRHHKCPIIVQAGTVCKYCLTLHSTLPRNEDNQRRQNRIRRVRIPSSPRTKNKVKILSAKKRIMQQQLNRQGKKCSNLTEELAKVHERFLEVKQNTIDIEIRNLSSKLPENQIALLRECLAVGKASDAKGRRYSHEWLLLCLLLYIRSSATYNMLRNNGVLPLPTKSTILKYLHASNVGCGFDENFFVLLGKKLQDYPEMAKEGILSFDEILVRKSIDLDVKTMTFAGLTDFGDSSMKTSNMNDQADHALVFMYSSLSYNFHQPVAMFGSKGSTPAIILASLLLQAIVAVEKCGGRVRGIVSDGASTNRCLWKKFGICGEFGKCKFSFENPFDEKRQIYVFSDVPHLIKCIRNRLQQKKYLKTHYGTVQWLYYERLFDRDCESNLRVCPKLTSCHIYPTQTMKMRVSLATQIFSNSVADGLKYYAQVEKREQPSTQSFVGYEATQLFTQHINRLFDALNKSYPSEAIRLGSKDFEVINEGIKWLDDWERVTTNKAEFLSSSTAQGLRVSLHSTLHLCNELLNHCNFKYILTNKMNQDCLERFFGIIRQAGGQNDHPTFATFKQLYHLLSVYTILKPPKFGNCSTENLPDDKNLHRITLLDFKHIFLEKKQSYKQQHINNLKQKLDHLIEHSHWECDDVITGDFGMSEVQSCIIYYISGYVCRQLLKRTQCNTCRDAFSSRYENLIAGCRESELVNVKSRGGLVHPNLHLVTIFNQIESYFQKHLDSADIYYLIISDMERDKIKLSFPCEEHKEDVITYCVHYYITVRMRQFAKLKNRKEINICKEKRKQAKLYCD